MHDFTGKRVLVTGATAGIGEATARAFVQAGAHVIATGRRKTRLTQLCKAWNKQGPGTAEGVVLDVTKRRSVESLAAKGHGDVDILVNNAGLARGKGPVQSGDYDDWKEMLDTNVLGLLSVFQVCAPGLAERRGHVVNLGSVAGRWVYPGGNVYSATKFAVRALTESMRIDLEGTGIRVTNIAPGAVDTEFSVVRFRGDRDKASKVYQGYEPLHADDIADTILWSCSRPAHVNIQELVVFPTAQASVRDLATHDTQVVEKATLRFDETPEKGSPSKPKAAASVQASAPTHEAPGETSPNPSPRAAPKTAAPEPAAGHVAQAVRPKAAFPPKFKGRAG